MEIGRCCTSVLNCIEAADGGPPIQKRMNSLVVLSPDSTKSVLISFRHPNQRGNWSLLHVPAQSKHFSAASRHAEYKSLYLVTFHVPTAVTAQIIRTPELLTFRRNLLPFICSDYGSLKVFKFLLSGISLSQDLHWSLSCIVHLPL